MEYYLIKFIKTWTIAFKTTMKNALSGNYAIFSVLFAHDYINRDNFEEIHGGNRNRINVIKRKGLNFKNYLVILSDKITLKK